MNIRKSTVLSLAFLMIFGCSGQKSNYSNEELAIIVADMHISEMSLKRHLGDLQDSLRAVFIEKLSTIHSISQGDLKREVELLMEDPVRHSEVYTIAISRLKKLEMQAKEKKDNPTKD